MKASLDSVGRRSVLLAIALVVACGLLLFLDATSWGPRSSHDDTRMFQRSVGGLGMGAAATPAWNIFYYDPRLQAVDDSSLWPVPGLYPFSPAAASAVFSFIELPRNDLRIIRVER